MELNVLDYWNDYEVGPFESVSTEKPLYLFELERENTPQTGQLNLEVPIKSTDWLMLSITDNEGACWVGRFEPGVEGITGLFATPNEKVICVVVKGQGYWVPINAPMQYEVIPSSPIKEVLSIPESNVVVFVDFVRLTAYGRAGLTWQTPDVSWDGIKVVGIDQNIIRGIGWDAPKNCDAPFIINADDGKCEGGSSPQAYSSNRT
ncbi:hypothetical protein [Mangrovitalea sediminis]|uniref:hypothetical protein n=1 Tax=Mangrovitalea sediminis TaxID=1982043 RepID=UPI000BE5D3E4|nr:hypothetical protein [Mangrovitalea sediminis]